MRSSGSGRVEEQLFGERKREEEEGEEEEGREAGLANLPELLRGILAGNALEDFGSAGVLVNELCVDTRSISF